jgi:coenzyme F420-0:L-glutamate ligase/coenzyme F420-1:gamma-L-glutamate ligase
MARLELIAPEGLPAVRDGDDLVALALRAWEAAAGPQQGDVLVLAQKIVSKAEGRRVALDGVEPSPEARDVAQQVGKDPRLVQLILSESRRIVRQRPGVLIVEHRLGWIMANAGIDQSNVDGGADDGCALLLPRDPDASAARLREALAQRCGVAPGVVINDSFGRPWRRGSVGVALGCAGLPALADLRGRADLFGRTLRATEVALADELASAASLLMGQGAEGRPLVVARGVMAGRERVPSAPALDLVRPAAEDLFR